MSLFLTVENPLLIFLRGWGKWISASRADRGDSFRISFEVEQVFASLDSSRIIAISTTT